ncbi:MAG: cardiolipin synthase, partial [Duncaniella sp.]|nr:cardiolipin synthase [Duncaniella sp.]
VEECLLAGIKIMLYNGGMLHAKTLLVDDDFATIGSVNFDFRSFEHNFEENIVMYSKDVNSFLANRFAEDSELCTRPRITEWAKRPRPMKIKQALARLLSPIL